MALALRDAADKKLERFFAYATFIRRNRSLAYLVCGLFDLGFNHQLLDHCDLRRAGCQPLTA